MAKTKKTNKDPKFKAGLDALLSSKQSKPERKAAKVVEEKELDAQVEQKVEEKIEKVLEKTRKRNQGEKKEKPTATGRKKWLKDEEPYGRLGNRIRKSTKTRMQIAIATHREQFPTQDLFVDYAINFALDHLEKQKK